MKSSNKLSLEFLKIEIEDGFEMLDELTHLIFSKSSVSIITYH